MLALVGGLIPAADQPHAAAQPPNIVVIMTDDQTVEMLRFMPLTRRLIGGRGVRFNNAFTSFPLCCPSRATFLTGLYAHNHGVITNVDGHQALGDQATIATILHDAGYHTMQVGKYLNGYGRDDARVPRGWSTWHGLVDAAAYAMYGYTLNNNGRTRTYGEYNGAEPDRLYQSDLLTRLAIKEIRAAPEPFFLNLAYLAPHRENRAADGLPAERDPRPARRHADRFASETLPRTPAFDETDLSDKPEPLASRAPLTARRIEMVDAQYRARARSLLAVDEGVARVIDELERRDALEDTLIVFTSDNGFLLGEHRVYEGKYLAYEPSIRVPLLIRGPGVERGATSGMFVSNIDLAPTLLAAAGISAEAMDGQPLQPYLAEPELRAPRAILLETTSGPEIARVAAALDLEDPAVSRGYVGIRTPRYSYVRYVSGDAELYDLARDPYQLTSVDADPSYDHVRAWLEVHLARLLTCAGVQCRIASGLIGDEPAPL